MEIHTEQRAIIRAGIVTGVGIGGFFDGIVLHQILQWHHMLTSAGYPPNNLQNLEINTLADGFFHAATWIITLIGIFLLWRALGQAKSTFPAGILAGTMLIGWGLFNVGEGIVNHHILQLHHVRPGTDQAFWDIAFLAWGVVMILGGWWLVRAQFERHI